MLTEDNLSMANMLTALLNLDESVLDMDQVENLIKICPTKEEVDMLKAGEERSLDNSEQFFLEMMRVPRIEIKLRVFSFKLQFTTKVAELWKNLMTLQEASKEVTESKKFRRIMQNAITFANSSSNQGNLNESDVGLKLESLLKLTDDSPVSNPKKKLMENFYKMISEKEADLLGFHKDLRHLEGASKILLTTMADEMQGIIRGLQKLGQELNASEKDGPISEGFRSVLKTFLKSAESDHRSLATFYLEVGRDADLLVQFFDRDPARCSFERVTSILFNFVTAFTKAGDENIKTDKESKDVAVPLTPDGSKVCA
ncbi:hypothetical protein MPTK1_3g24420 [Marchantia polymorpha subsp. ruderalis]|uniref:FH2 domain-containing protein n=2 Tax=Marchantia polymorpha TaxID=3197 RepID=A0AAF6B4C2_MARPO|nr:hypothetical protein MARPO_0178s0012 [Marchantia polymorpha]PTQ27961.1 hypothetical protein MARPO_0178s0012 [Marchantia polymorpha]BBN06855.1 hypothetical protein Mp_3g24420 [Marchantia polymorpha subsp. ruderalis]BBN06856.1 hypothetical protein Mp_3g24420 [Marchantia polymorpha subsp. ruderalis]|eukprot:PTQ27960.1 hypothetical protein MARPO_0178s0012 [Marchantia polymorpha]